MDMAMGEVDKEGLRRGLSRLPSVGFLGWVCQSVEMSRVFELGLKFLQVLVFLHTATPNQTPVAFGLLAFGSMGIGDLLAQLLQLNLHDLGRLSQLRHGVLQQALLNAEVYSSAPVVAAAETEVRRRLFGGQDLG